MAVCWLSARTCSFFRSSLPVRASALSPQEALCNMPGIKSCAKRSFSPAAAMAALSWRGTCRPEALKIHMLPAAIPTL